MSSELEEYAKRALASEEKVKFLEDIIAWLPGNIYWMDADCRMLGCNQNVLDMLGLKTTEFIGKTYDELAIIANWKDGQNISYKNDDLMILTTGESIRNKEDIPLPHKNGGLFHFLTNRGPLKNATGKVIGVVGTSVDITELKEARLALKAAQERETEIRRAVMIVAGSMAHDLRNPLVAAEMISNSMSEDLVILVEGYKKARAAGLLEGEAALADFQIDYLSTAPDKLLESIGQMNTFINDDLKTLSRVVNGSKSQEDLVPCRMNSCIREAMNHYPFAANEKELVDVKSNGDFTFSGNPVLFYRIIFNLLKNALYQIKKNGQGKIFISTESKDDINILRFKDTAGGVTNEIVSSLFEGFNTTKQEGTGIGLAFCKFTMQSFGGDIVANCDQDGCIEFVLSFLKF